MLRVAKAAMKAGRKPNLNPGVCRTSRVQKAKKKKHHHNVIFKTKCSAVFVKKKWKIAQLLEKLARRKILFG